MLPESLEERTLTAADRALADELADIILIGNEQEIFSLADKLGLKHVGKATIIDPATSPKTEEYAQLLFQLRQKKGMTIEEARRKVMPTDRLAAHSQPPATLFAPHFRSSSALLECLA